MIRLAVSVEGQTEESFVKDVLASHLRPSEIEPTPILLGNARGSGGGGNVSMQRLSSEMSTLFWNYDAVTSLVDFYGFVGKASRTVQELERDLNQRIQENVTTAWDQRRVVPYIQRHEFEGLLFSDVNAFGTVLVSVTEQAIVQLRAVRTLFPTPEDINDSQVTAPSKRIARVIPGYRKRLHGPLVAGEIGLTVTRRECPRFDNWLMQLEALEIILD